jgi:hypothetical protein
MVYIALQLVRPGPGGGQLRRVTLKRGAWGPEHAVVEPAEPPANEPGRSRIGSIIGMERLRSGGVSGAGVEVWKGEHQDGREGPLRGDLA